MLLYIPLFVVFCWYYLLSFSSLTKITVTGQRANDYDGRTFRNENFNLVINQTYDYCRQNPRICIPNPMICIEF